jgi:hypothetical protein
MIHIDSIATLDAARLRMVASCPESAAQPQKAGRRAGVVALVYGTTPAFIQDPATGVRAWSPPV